MKRAPLSLFKTTMMKSPHGVLQMETPSLMLWYPLSVTRLTPFTFDFNQTKIGYNLGTEIVGMDREPGDILTWHIAKSAKSASYSVHSHIATIRTQSPHELGFGQAVKISGMPDDSLNSNSVMIQDATPMSLAYIAPDAPDTDETPWTDGVITVGQLPNDLTLSEDGHITGTPTYIFDPSLPATGFWQDGSNSPGIPPGTTFPGFQFAELGIVAKNSRTKRLALGAVELSYLMAARIAGAFTGGPVIDAIFTANGAIPSAGFRVDSPGHGILEIVTPSPGVWKAIASNGDNNYSSSSESDTLFGTYLLDGPSGPPGEFTVSES